MNDKTARVFSVGETVFDIIFRDYQPRAAKPGGSAFNAMVSLGRLGIPGSFISEVGNDRLGHYIRDFLKENGVDNSYVAMFEDGKSALALAFLDDSSDAQYDFYKDYPAQRLNNRMPEFSKGDYFLFGSFYGLNPVLRPQIRGLLNRANQSRAIIYYDPNFRSSHLDDLEVLIPIIEENFAASTIVRASDEDMRNIYQVETFEAAWEKVSSFCDYFIYTANAKGVDLAAPGIRLHIDVDQIQPVSTIGAGDTFNAGILYGLYKKGIDKDSLSDMKGSEWKEILQTAAGFSKEVCMSYDNYVAVRKGEQN